MERREYPHDALRVGKTGRKAIVAALDIHPQRIGIEPWLFRSRSPFGPAQLFLILGITVEEDAPEHADARAVEMLAPAAKPPLLADTAAQHRRDAPQRSENPPLPAVLAGISGALTKPHKTLT